MPLLTRISQHHTIREFRAAAGFRYSEGRRLALAGDRLMAIYLWGYAAEMLLKAAFFRLRGWPIAMPITVADMRNARAYAITTLHLAWPQPTLHDLPRWRDLLLEERKRQLLAYPGPFARSLNGRVTRIYINWREHLRYRINRPYSGEVARTYDAVGWLLGQYRHL